MIQFQIIVINISLWFISLNQNNDYSTKLLAQNKADANTLLWLLIFSNISCGIKRSWGSSGNRNIQSNLYALKSKLNDDDNVDDGYLSARVSSFVWCIFCIFLYPHIIDPFITQAYWVQYFDIMNTVCNSVNQYKIIHFSI